MIRRLKQLLFRIKRRLRGRDLCEFCEGLCGEPGNENAIRLPWCIMLMCDYCHARFLAAGYDFTSPP